MKKHRIGALLAAGALLLTFAGTALAVDTTVGWDGNGWPITQNCTDSAPGTMLWIYTGDSSSADPILTVNGAVPAQQVSQPGQGSWHIVTAYLDSKPSEANTFVTFFGAGGGVLTISHGCAPEASPSPSESTPVQSESVPPSESPSPSESTPVQSESVPPSDGASPSESASASASASQSQPVSSPSGSVLAETGTPQITPPSTDTVGSSSGSAGSGLPLVLAAASVLLLAVLIATPSRKRSRR